MARILGVDYGDSRIGLAISDQTKSIAFPFRTIKNDGLEVLIEFLGKVRFEKKIESVVVGLPLGLDGRDTNQTKKVRNFSEEIKILGLPIYLQDERLSSVSAKKSLIKENVKTGHNKEKIDERAASIVLQHYLDINK